MRYEKKDAETTPAKHTVYLDATDMERAAIMYVRYLWGTGEYVALQECPTDSAVLSIGSSHDERDHSLTWHTED